MLLLMVVPPSRTVRAMVPSDPGGPEGGRFRLVRRTGGTERSPSRCCGIVGSWETDCVRPRAGTGLSLFIAQSASGARRPQKLCPCWRSVAGTSPPSASYTSRSRPGCCQGVRPLPRYAESRLAGRRSVIVVTSSGAPCLAPWMPLLLPESLQLQFRLSRSGKGATV